MYMKLLLTGANSTGNSIKFMFCFNRTLLFTFQIDKLTLVVTQSHK